jgi:hypothetical protein
MKKVRYLAGAVGVAPVLGLMMQPGNGAAAVTHPSADKGKTVSLAHIKALNIGDCRNPSEDLVSSSRGFHGTVYGTLGASCISLVYGALGGRHEDLDMRTRFYSLNNKKIGGDHFNHFFSYSPIANTTTWYHTTTTDAFRACIALVLAANHNSVKHGPICGSI